MTSRQLFAAIGLVDEDLILQAAAKPRRPGRVLRRALPLAACLTLALLGALWWQGTPAPPAAGPAQQSLPAASPDAPATPAPATAAPAPQAETLDAAEKAAGLPAALAEAITPAAGGMGADWLLAADVSELTLPDLLNGQTPAALPVYRGLLADLELNEARMRAILAETLTALGQDPALADGAQLSWQVAGLDAAAPEEMGRKIVEQSGVRAVLDFWGGLCRLEVTLGDGRRLSVLNDGTLECTPGQEDAFVAADLVLDANRPLLEALGGYTRLLPGPNYGRSYSDGSLTESPPVLGKAGDSPAQALFGRDLAVLRSCRTDGEAALTGFTLFGSARAESMGEYPVITREEAEALLCAGSYLDAEFIPVGPGEGTVVSAELCYLPGRSQYYVPMWRFLVDMGVAEAPAQVSEEGADPALHAYREYYVPATPLDTLTALVTDPAGD